MKNMSTCLWFDGQAEEAAHFYGSVFKNSKIKNIAHYSESGAEASGNKKGSVMTVNFEIENQKILGLNGGPHFKFTQAFSFFVWCETEQEIDSLWKKLSDGGTIRMDLAQYPWSKKYGWTSDRFGVNWQLNLAPNSEKIAPSFLFVDKLFGKGQAALDFYTSVFENSKVEFMAKDEKTNSIMHAVFSLNRNTFVLMEGQGKHDFTFNEAFSLVVTCETQKELDKYWQKLSAGGSESQCGWLKDQFGVSWQIVPALVEKWMTDPDPAKSERVMKAVMEMKKLDIEKLTKAYNGG